MKILVFTSLFPNKIHPNNAIFIKNRMEAVQRCDNINVKVVAPVPYFPSLPHIGSRFKRWHHFSEIPRQEYIGELEVYHPRYLVTPKIGMSLYGVAMFLAALPTVKRIYKTYPFDIIDGHYIYPDGFAAVLLGRLLKIPVVLSARGTDINLYPQFTLIKHLIQCTLKRADKCISVCNDLKKTMVSLGAEAQHIDIIPNGIDPAKFYRLDKIVARQSAGVPIDKKILLSVGSLIERKGHHLLIEALARLKKENNLFFDTYILGQGEWYERLAEMINRNGLGQNVFLRGHVSNEMLVYWYNSADLLFLGSSREGWPNVVSEALACGIPVIATKVNGIPEIITQDAYGVVVQERSIESFHREIPKAFKRPWDYEQIYKYGQGRTWDQVALEVCATFAQVMAKSNGQFCAAHE